MTYRIGSRAWRKSHNLFDLFGLSVKNYTFFKVYSHNFFSQKFIIFGDLAINIAVSFFRFRDTCADKFNITSMAYNNITDSAQKKDIILIHNTVYLGDQ